MLTRGQHLITGQYCLRDGAIIQWYCADSRTDSRLLILLLPLNILKLMIHIHIFIARFLTIRLRHYYRLVL